MKRWSIRLMLSLLVTFYLLSDTSLAQAPTLDAWAIVPIGVSGGNNLEVGTGGPIVADESQGGLQVIIGFAGPASQAGQSGGSGVVYLPVLIKQ